ncbi:Flp pilus assembly protein CpaB [Candidatus Hydrogenisulfobacillus filiaventi]|uniref:Flp pilus assembly protein CpaB n=1 Tax=Candidatus Hydrogenisulfobacillus filiaventi TaxID=2707344 RepID=A0A6F8ZCY6_9FIRM|nr:Flp pilus assembly protein CpaB [Bacillota bacterium]CAB1127886.1 Flp pilus assembly protein CpaB [Candidatus Hydrogenisulfobacillus filiaventi]
MATAWLRLRAFVLVNRWILLAALLAAAAAEATLLALHPRTAAVPAAPAPGVRLAVLTRPVGPDQPIPASAVAWQTYPLRLVPPGAIRSPAALAGAWSAEALTPGVPLTAAEVFRPREANVLAARVAPGTEALAVPVSADNAVDGMVSPGDRISLYTTVTGPGGHPRTVQVFRELPVLAVDGSLSPAAPTPGRGFTLLLALPPSAVTELLYIMQHGPLTVTLDGPSPAPKPAPFGQAQWENLH